ncbi:MAG TPA: ABC transporter substrate-binding protein [Candidatus Magasanikbacteria bacterium]|nr:ABC transporter substrate-binding protein [Candidatus Magasanikbacteria bacterium]
MDKKIRVGIFAVAIMVILSGCAQTNIDQSKKENLKIGVVAPLTGEMATWGESVRGGAEIAVDEINSTGGVNGQKIDLIFEDNFACDKTASVNAINKLIKMNNSKINLMTCSGAVLATAPITEQAKTIMMVPGGSTAAIAEAGDYVFRTTISDDIQAKNLSKFIADSMKIKRIAIIYVNNDYGVGFFNNLSTEISTNGGQIVKSEKYSPEDTEFRTQLTNIKNTSPDALIIICYGKEGGTIAKQARELGIRVQLIGTDNFGTNEVATAGGQAVDGAIFSTEGIDMEQPRTKHLIDAYTQKYNHVPPVDYVVADTYDAIRLLADAISARGYNPDGIKDYLYGVKDYAGASGVITMNSNGDAFKPTQIRQIRNGKLVNYQN